MLINVISGGWVQDKGRDEFAVQLKLVGNDSHDVEHLASMVGDDFSVAASFAGGALTLDVVATRKVPLSVQAEQKAAAEQAAAEDAKAKADAAAAEAAATAEKNAKVAAVAAAAAKAAVDAMKDQIS